VTAPEKQLCQSIPQVNDPPRRGGSAGARLDTMAGMFHLQNFRVALLQSLSQDS
jgi:hypothetical protein